MFLFLMSLVFVSMATPKSLWCEQYCKRKNDILKVGYDRLHNRTLYACRTNLWGSMQIGHTWYGRDRCHLPYGGKIYTVDKYALLKNVEGSWQPYYGFFPDNALILGDGIKKVKLALCRGFYKRSLIPGKTWTGHNSCDIVLRGKAIALKRYSIFVKTV